MGHFRAPQVDNGIVKNWEDMERLWNYTFFDKLKVRASFLLKPGRPDTSLAANTSW